MVAANSRINVERLRKEDREALEEMAEELCQMATRIEKLRDLFEGKLHTVWMTRSRRSRDWNWSSFSHFAPWATQDSLISVYKLGRPDRRHHQRESCILHEIYI